MRKLEGMFAITVNIKKNEDDKENSKSGKPVHESFVTTFQDLGRDVPEP
jgi:hypothetical protein